MLDSTDSLYYNTIKGGLRENQRSTRENQNISLQEMSVDSDAGYRDDGRGKGRNVRKLQEELDNSFFYGKKAQKKRNINRSFIAFIRFK